MTLLPWVWFGAGTLAGSLVLAALAVLCGKACRRGADRVRFLRFTFCGLLAVPILQLGGWVPRWDLGRPVAPGVEAVSPGTGGGVVPVGLPAPNEVAVWPAAVWLGGWAVFAAAFILRRAHLAGRLRRLPNWADDAVRGRVADVVARLGVGRVPALRVGRAGCSPFVCGIVRPVLVLPADFDRLFSPAQQEAVLAHEFGHLAGRDPLWAAVGEFTAAAVWWNPVVWWTRAVHRAACEAAADDATAVLADGPGLLAESLFVLAGRMVGTPTAAAAVGGGCRSALARRVRRLLAGDPAAPAVGGWFRRVAAGIGMACGVTTAAVSCMALTRTAGGEQIGPALARQLWATPSAQTPPDRPGRPQTLGDLHPDLRADPENADLAGYRLSVVRVDAEGRSRPTGEAGPLATEADAFDHVGVSATQRERLLALKAENWEATKAMYRGPVSERMRRGMEINRRWRAGLQAVLSADQYHRYLAFWQDRPTVAVRLPN